MRDGWSSAGSMGLGLPGARRLMDEFEIASRPGRGTTVTMIRWRASLAGAPSAPLVDWAAAPTVAPVGRRAVVCQSRGGVLVAAVAAAGQGGRADLAADMAAAVLERHARESPIALVERCHRALVGTGGAAIGIASLSRLDSRMTWLTLGALQGTLVRGVDRHSKPTTAPALRGSAGGHLPSLCAATLTLTPEDTLVLAAGRPLPARVAEGLGRAAPQLVAERLLVVLGPEGFAVVARRR